jgi:hypothetical protein
MSETRWQKGRMYRTVDAEFAVIDRIEGDIIRGRLCEEPFDTGRYFSWEARTGKPLRSGSPGDALTDAEFDKSTGEHVKRAETWGELYGGRHEIDDQLLGLAGAPTPYALMSATGYVQLADILAAAFQQSATGKGRARHQRGETPWIEQPILTIARRRGVGFQLGQVEKKVDEADMMIERGEHDAAERELLGAIVYLAATVQLIRERRNVKKEG